MDVSARTRAITLSALADDNDYLRERIAELERALGNPKNSVDLVKQLHEKIQAECLGAAFDNELIAINNYIAEVNRELHKHKLALAEADTHASELEQSLKVVEAANVELRKDAITAAKARAEERERCLKAKPEAPEIVLEPFTDDARTQWACGYEAALDDWEKEIRALGG